MAEAREQTRAPVSGEAEEARAAFIEEVEKRLAFNVVAYGTAWTGERAVTEFIVSDALAAYEAARPDTYEDAVCAVARYIEDNSTEAEESKDDWLAQAREFVDALDDLEAARPDGERVEPSAEDVARAWMTDYDSDPLPIDEEDEWRTTPLNLVRQVLAARAALSVPVQAQPDGEE